MQYQNREVIDCYEFLSLFIVLFMKKQDYINFIYNEWLNSPIECNVINSPTGIINLLHYNSKILISLNNHLRYDFVKNLLCNNKITDLNISYIMSLMFYLSKNSINIILVSKDTINKYLYTNYNDEKFQYICSSIENDDLKTIKYITHWEYNNEGKAKLLIEQPLFVLENIYNYIYESQKKH